MSFQTFKMIKVLHSPNGRDFTMMLQDLKQ